MANYNRVEDIAEKLARVMPESLRGLRSEFGHNIRALLQANLERLDLVSRERFEVQAAQLARAQQRLKVLEERLKVLERTAGTLPVSDEESPGSDSGS